MLQRLHIRDYAIIDDTTLELGDQLSVLTGETGAGKSILLDAMGLLLGDRADAGAVRQGAQRADVQAAFILTDAHPALLWLQEHELDDEDHCLLRRTVNREGRSRAYINAHQATRAQLETLGEMLVNIHGQHAHQQLTHPAQQLRLLDAFAAHGELLAQVSSAYREWSDAERARNERQQQRQQADQRNDELRRYLPEFDDLQISESDVEALCAEHLRLSAAGQLLNDSTAVLHCLDDNLLTALQQLHRLIDAVQDPHSEAWKHCADNARIELEELRDQVQSFQRGFNAEPEREQWLDAQVSLLYRLARKHLVDIHHVPALHTSLQQELHSLAGVDDDLEALAQQCRASEAKFRSASEALRTSRHAAGKRLAQQIHREMASLELGGGEFAVAIEDTKPSATGVDAVRFLVSTNPGQAPRALEKVASGGELSRLSLAIQLILSRYQAAHTLVFDEVDTGIGGGVAERVGERLRILGDTRQVLCVTHLAQVAAKAHAHLVVEKHTSATHTRTALRALSNNERVEEIARMIGGVTLTDAVHAHAKELLTIR